MASNALIVSFLMVKIYPLFWCIIFITVIMLDLWPYHWYFEIFFQGSKAAIARVLLCVVLIWVVNCNYFHCISVVRDTIFCLHGSWQESSCGDHQRNFITSGTERDILILVQELFLCLSLYATLFGTINIVLTLAEKAIFFYCNHVLLQFNETLKE